MPRSPEPPGLLRAAQALSHPDVSSAGLTTTPDGRWALLVRVRPGARTPIAEVEQAAGGHPVIYQPEPDDLPVARPAYPLLGE
jgi:hypothetical protein